MAGGGRGEGRRLCLGLRFLVLPGENGVVFSARRAVIPVFSRRPTAVDGSLG